MGRIAVAVSGGVDSLCALLKLHEAGHDVLALHGLFLPRLQDCPRPDPVPALSVACHKLGVPLHIVDLQDVFYREVIAPFARAYAVGKTPNPCAHCNQCIKFGALLDAALELGADKMATGHYARLLDAGPTPVLLAASDGAKDQSYFLSLVPVERLRCLVFPLGEQSKPQSVRMVAVAGLTVPLVKESQDVCFIPSGGRAAYRPFLERHWEKLGLSAPQQGSIFLADANGQEQEIGIHKGLWRYTEGQRKGINIAFSEPLYVIGKDCARNVLLVGPRALPSMKSCVTEQANILVTSGLWPERVWARLRYHGRLEPARARLRDGCLHISFENRQMPGAPGQVAALYNDDGCILAAGIMASFD